MHSAGPERAARQGPKSGTILGMRNKAVFKSLITLNPAKHELRFARLPPIALVHNTLKSPRRPVCFQTAERSCLAGVRAVSRLPGADRQDPDERQRDDPEGDPGCRRAERVNLRSRDGRCQGL